MAKLDRRLRGASTQVRRSRWWSVFSLVGLSPWVSSDFVSGIGPRWSCSAETGRDLASPRSRVVAKFFNFDAASDNVPLQLFRAAGAGNDADVERLLREGAKPNKRSGSSKATPLIVAAANGHDIVVKLLIEAGAELDQGIENDGPLRPGGATALFMAAQQGHEEVVKVLLEAGADFSRPRGDGRTPLAAAEKKGHEAVASLLRAASSSEET
mmetsp:Transcript_48162/g.86666  ORF Transcript_48162/g.86666 Transcript_48162/m.86666 type:complete len:212 (+) Transcript_48162:40-675(+)